MLHRTYSVVSAQFQCLVLVMTLFVLRIFWIWQHDCIIFGLWCFIELAWPCLFSCCPSIPVPTSLISSSMEVNGVVTRCLFYTLVISSACLCWRYGHVVMTVSFTHVLNLACFLVCIFASARMGLPCFYVCLHSLKGVGAGGVLVYYIHNG